MDSGLDKNVVVGSAQAIVRILKDVKTLLSLAALALLIVLAIVCFALYQSSTRSDWLVLALTVIGCTLAVLIVFLAQRIAPASQPSVVEQRRDAPCETGEGHAHDEPSKLLVFRHV